MPTVTAFDKDGLKIIFSLEKVPDSNTLTVNVTATNNTLSNMSDFLFQAAVPKVMFFPHVLCVKLFRFRHSSCKCCHRLEL